MHPEVTEKARQARAAARVLANSSTAEKNRVLLLIAEALQERAKQILAANKTDLDNLKQKPGYTEAFHDRLLLTPERINGMAGGLQEIITLEDPVGEVEGMSRRPNGLQIGRIRVPIGVIGIIYEARPNVTIDATGLTLKAGNAVMLRGSSEAIYSNQALVEIIQEQLVKAGLPAGAVSLIEDTDRSAARAMMQLNQYLDLLIPRGGPSLISSVVENSTVPVIETGAGNCHIYVDDGANLEKAVAIVLNAKVQRPGVCNALETLLVHQKIASQLIPTLVSKLLSQGVEVRGCSATQRYHQEIKPATEQDWETEYLDLILAIKIVGSLQEATEHINRYGTGHSEAILTADYYRAREFLSRVDAAAVYVNASTRFTDGNEFGLGAEMGISTQKLHARGPMGLKELTNLKYIIYGEGQIRQ